MQTTNHLIILSFVASKDQGLNQGLNQISSKLYRTYNFEPDLLPIVVGARLEQTDIEKDNVEI